MQPTSHGPSVRALILPVLLLLLSLNPGALLHAASLSGQVLAVLTGDRLVITNDLGERRAVRLLGILAARPDSPDGRRAHRYLRGLLAGKFVRLDYHRLTPEGEPQGTLLHGGADIGLRLLESGLVRFKDDPALPAPLRLRYRDAQAAARRGRLGIWSK